MSLTPLQVYEKLVLRAILTNENDVWIQAHALSYTSGFTPQQIEACHENVDRWLRLHGVTTMKEHEKSALVLIQSTIRRWLILRDLKHQYDMYSRLAQLDSPDHCKRALSLQTTLACAWHRIHSC